MAAASQMIKAWARQNSKYSFPQRWKLTRQRLSLKTNKFVHYIGKGWHITPLMGWLTHFLEDLEIDDRFKMLAWSGNYLMQALHNSRADGGLLLSAEMVESVQAVGYYHVTLFLELHQAYQDWGAFRLFNPRPKLHNLCHLLDSCSTRRNPVSSSCWMEEDWVRATAALARKTHASSMQLSLLRRYAAGAKPFSSRRAAAGLGSVLPGAAQPSVFFGGCVCSGGEGA